jgi:hypothetical protein
MQKQNEKMNKDNLRAAVRTCIIRPTHVDGKKAPGEMVYFNIHFPKKD